MLGRIITVSRLSGKPRPFPSPSCSWNATRSGAKNAHRTLMRLYLDAGRPRAHWRNTNDAPQCSARNSGSIRYPKPNSWPQRSAPVSCVQTTWTTGRSPTTSTPAETQSNRRLPRVMAKLRSTRNAYWPALPGPVIGSRRLGLLVIVRTFLSWSPTGSS